MPLLKSKTALLLSKESRFLFGSGSFLKHPVALARPADGIPRMGRDARRRRCGRPGGNGVKLLVFHPGPEQMGSARMGKHLPVDPGPVAGEGVGKNPPAACPPWAFLSFPPKRRRPRRSPRGFPGRVLVKGRLVKRVGRTSFHEFRAFCLRCFCVCFGACAFLRFSPAAGPAAGLSGGGALSAGATLSAGAARSLDWFSSMKEAIIPPRSASEHAAHSVSPLAGPVFPGLAPKPGFLPDPGRRRNLNSLRGMPVSGSLAASSGRVRRLYCAPTGALASSSGS